MLHVCFIDDSVHPGGRHLLAALEGINCTPAAIDDFPSDGLTREQRQHGWVAIHAVIACYCFTLLAIVCDDYFVPAVKKICQGTYYTNLVKNVLNNCVSRFDAS